MHNTTDKLTTFHNIAHTKNSSLAGYGAGVGSCVGPSYNIYTSLRPIGLCRRQKCCNALFDQCTPYRNTIFIIIYTIFAETDLVEQIFDPYTCRSILLKFHFYHSVIFWTRLFAAVSQSFIYGLLHGWIAISPCPSLCLYLVQTLLPVQPEANSLRN